jgi:hypothetical protein
LIQSEVRFNRNLEQVPEKVPEKLIGAFGAKPSKFNRVPEKIPEKIPEKVPKKNPVKVWEALVQRRIRFKRVPEKFPEKLLGDFGADLSQVQ